ncbi:MAG: hypothetical protein VX766_07585 [Pseudomonadota bacterium]|nr:hypothetical protein [Pseudomonadota bacterium]
MGASVLPIELHAGARIRAHVAREGFRFEDFPQVLGAAGGPKWLSLYGMDRVLAPRVRAAARSRGTPTDLIGASIGAWRFAAWALDDPVAALDRLFEAYVDPTPFANPTASFDALFRHYLDAMFEDGGREQILECVPLKLHAIVAGFSARGPHLPRLGWAAVRNAVSRERFLRGLERIIVGARPLDAELASAWPHRHLALDADTLVPALLATAAVPGMLAPIRDLDPKVRAIDGGIVDYHFDGSPCAGRFTLYPHFRDTLTPGWFDKPWRARHRAAAEVDDLLVICPSPAFVAELPGARIPDRGDPRRYGAEACARNWRRAGELSRRLGEALEDVLERDRIPELLAGAA